MYKDKDKQREANRKAQAKFKAKSKGITEQGVTEQGITEQEFIKEAAKIFDVPERTAQGNIRVSKPGDIDYEPQGVTTQDGYYQKVNQVAKSPKRGKDIKCFADLPPDVQTTIDRMSINKDGTINQTVKAKRTTAAIKYQHLYPGRYYSTGAALNMSVFRKR